MQKYKNQNHRMSAGKPLTILTSRFNDKTWETNQANRIKKDIACYYTAPCLINDSISRFSLLAVIEMNNDTNEIMGVGLVKNRPQKVDTHFIYSGTHWISRDAVEEYSPELLYTLERILFRGYTHSKRGQGLTKIPDKVVKQYFDDIATFQYRIRTMFKCIFGETGHVENK